MPFTSCRESWCLGTPVGDIEILISKLEDAASTAHRRGSEIESLRRKLKQRESDVEAAQRQAFDQSLALQSANAQVAQHAQSEAGEGLLYARCLEIDVFC